jgi:hypothetical protein
MADYKYTCQGWAEAFGILAKYEHEDDYVFSTHDKIWAGDKSVSDVDRIRLEALDWHWDDRICAFYHDV